MEAGGSLYAYNKSTAAGTLCEYCTRYDWECLPSFNWFSSKDITYIQKGYAHHPSWRSLRHSAVSCVMCKMIEHEVLQSLAFRQQKGEPVQILREDVIEGRGALPIMRMVNEKRLDTEDYTRIHLWLEQGYQHQPSNMMILCPGLRAIDVEDRSKTDYRVHSYTDWHESRKLYPRYDDTPRLEIWTSEGDPMVQSGISSRARIPRLSLDSIDVSLMKDWIKECYHNHRECSGDPQHLPNRSDLSRPLPKRVLQITGDPADPCIRLYETEGDLGEYVALSYCWGTSTSLDFLTTTETIDARKKRIRIRDLPQTYVDAIRITQKLDKQYLWIDALCIIQHSSDWDAEASKMGQYYGNAVVTLSANSCSSTSMGFLHEETSVFDPMEITFIRPMLPTSCIYISRSIYDYPDSVPNHRSPAGLWNSNVEQCPLSTRAWTLQERILAPRKLHFGADHLFWECRSSRLAQGGAAYLQAVSYPTLQLNSLHTALNTANWYYLVSLYSTRRLTKPSDRLIAISGLAKLFHAEIQQLYLAGIWAHEMHDGLAWKVQSNTSVNRPATNTTPTWSWASLEGSIETRDTGNAPAFIVISARTKLLGSDPFGAVIGGELILKGQLKRVRFRADSPKTMFALQSTYESDVNSGHDITSLDIRFDSTWDGEKDVKHYYRNDIEIACPYDYKDDRSRIFGGSNVVGEYRDDLHKTHEGDILWAFRLTSVKAVQGPSLPLFQDVMVLEQVENTYDAVLEEKTYRRVGAGWTWDEDFFSDCSMEILRII